MLSPFNIFQKPEDVKPYIDDNEKLILPICDNIVFALGKILDPFEDDLAVYDRNQATIIGAFVKLNSVGYLLNFSENDDTLSVIWYLLQNCHLQQLLVT